MASAFEQVSFQIRVDDVGLNSPSFTYPLNTNATITAGVPFRIRYAIRETGTGATNDVTFTQYIDYNAGADYDEWGEGEFLFPEESTQYSNGATTTQVIGVGTYITGESLGGVEGEDNLHTGNIDVLQSRIFELEFCFIIDPTNVDTGDTFDLRVRRANGTVLASYAVTPRITVFVPPSPDVYSFLGDVVWANDHTTMTQWVGNDLFQKGILDTHPYGTPPILVTRGVSSLRMKVSGLPGKPGTFPPGVEDTITQTITVSGQNLAAGRYVYEYYQVQHDDGERETWLLSGAGEAIVMYIAGTQADDTTRWWGPFHHVFDHVGGVLKLRIRYLAPSNPPIDDGGIKDAAIMIRRYVGLGTLGLTASGSQYTVGQRPATLPARSLAMTLEER